MIESTADNNLIRSNSGPIRAAHIANDIRNQKDEKILCNHCGRTASNGIRCIGLCVADNEY